MRNRDIENKKILILGGGVAALDVVNEAKKLGLYVIATDNLNGGVAKEKADESYQISTTDIESLTKLVEKKHVDGIFCGPSEFNIVNTMNLCESVNLPFYISREQWDLCSNKLSFKKLCRDFNVPCVKEYKIDDCDNMKLPVIVKPVDGNSSEGISVCSEKSQIINAYKKAIQASKSSQAIIEEYVESEGCGINVRYVVKDGKPYFFLAGDSYTVDPFEKSALINAVGIYPSIHTEYYLKNINDNVCEMLKAMDLDNTTLFMQAVTGRDIFFHEMGLRLSGGLVYNITEPLTGFNDLKMMLRNAVGEEFDKGDIANIDPYLSGNTACIFCIPLKAGKIGKIEGMDKIVKEVNLDSFIQYYKENDIVNEKDIGSLKQLFGRFKFSAHSINNIVDIIDFIQGNLTIYNIDGEPMIFKSFDTNRIFNNNLF